MSNFSAEMDNAIEKLHQNFQDLRYHLEKAFLEQGRALLKFEEQWKDLKNEHTKENEQRQVHLQQMGFPIPSNGTEHFATANSNSGLWSNTTARTSGIGASGNGASGNGASRNGPSGNGASRNGPSGNGTFGNGAPKHHCDVCNIFCDTKVVLDKHKLGKKHKMNLDKLKGKTIPGPPKKRAPDQPAENLETKRRKVLQSGAAAHSLRTCSLCNVVCISEYDFNIHRGGQRHAEAAAMAKRHGVGTSGTSGQRRFPGWNQ